LVTPQEKPLIAQLVSMSQPPPWFLVTPQEKPLIAQLVSMPP